MSSLYDNYPVYNPSNNPTNTTTTNLQVGYSVSQPVEITTNSANGPLTVQQGVNDSNMNFQGLNLAGTSTFSVTGAGLLTNSGEQVNGNAVVTGQVSASALYLTPNNYPSTSTAVFGQNTLNHITATSTNTFDLPTNPVDGCQVVVVDGSNNFAVHNIIIATTDGSVISGGGATSTNTYTCNTNSGYYLFQYQSSNTTWVMLNNIGSGGAGTLQTVSNNSGTANPSILLSSIVPIIGIKSNDNVNVMLDLQDTTGAQNHKWYPNGDYKCNGTVFSSVVSSGTIYGAGEILSSTTPSTSVTTGALQVAGGVGVQGQITTGQFLLADNELNLSTIGASTQLMPGRQYSINLTASGNSFLLPTATQGLVSGHEVIIVDENSSFGVQLPILDAGSGNTIAGADATGVQLYTMNSNSGVYRLIWADYNSQWLMINNTQPYGPRVSTSTNTTVSVSNTYPPAGSNNTIMGYNAGLVTTTGGDNVGVGARTLSYLTSGAQNTVLGSGAGVGITSGTNNILIGFGQNSVTSQSNQTVIGNSSTASTTIYGATNVPNLLSCNSFYQVDNELTLNVANANTNLSANTSYSVIVVSVTGNTLTLPVAPLSGSIVTIVIESANVSSYPVSVIISSGSGATIAGQGIASPVTSFTLTNNYGYYVFNYTDTNKVWVLLDNIQSASSIYGPFAPNSTSLAVTDSTLATSSNNTVTMGRVTGSSSLTGNDNVVMGYNVMSAGTSAARDVCIGSGAGNSISTGVENMLVGYGAGGPISTAQRNVGLGAYVLNACNGDSNLALGWAAMYTGGSTIYSTQTQNVAIGSNALRIIQGSNTNVAIGYQAGYPNASGGITTGSSNTLVGSNSGVGLSGGNNNICIGAGAGFTSDVSNSTVIGNASTLYAQIYGSLSMTPRMNTGYQLGYTLSTVTGSAPATNVPNGNYTFWSSNTSTGLVGDTFLMTFTGLPAGNYLSCILALAYMNAGIWSMEISTNGGAYSTLYYAIDGYLSASTNPLSCPYFVQHLGGNLVIRVKCTGKNASAGAYRIQVCHWQSTPTSLTAITANQWATQGNQTGASIYNYSVANGGVAFGGVAGVTGASMYGWGGLPNFQNFNCPTFYNVIY